MEKRKLLGNFVMMVLTFLHILLFGGAGIMPALERVDSIIESHPDSAYVMLTAMDRSAMSRKEAARFSVLYSMALDKRYIDVASDSIICNAVKYYRHHGDADYKMRAYYYQGRVRQNAEDIDGAMESFVKAEHFGRKSDNLLMRGRVYTGLQTIHLSLFDIERAFDYAHKSADCFLAAGDTSRYINSRLDECTNLNSLGRYNLERTILDEMDSFRPLMNNKQFNNYLMIQLKLDLASGVGTLESVKNQLKQISSVPTNIWLSIAYLFVRYDDAESAKNALTNYEDDSSADLSKPFYHLVRSKIYASEQNYSEAFFSLSEYVNVSDSVDLQLIRSSAPYAEERYEHQLADIQHQYRLAILLLLLVVAALGVFLIKNRLDEQRHKVTSLQEERIALESEAREYSRQIEEAGKEIIQLKRILSESTLNEDTLKQVRVRLDILNKFVANQLSNSASNGGQDDIRELLENRGEFLKSMATTFSVSHPQFVQYLKDSGMTERETGCCCLYCIGLRGSEIASYLGLSDNSYYNFSSKLKKKLAKEGDTSTIGKILKEKVLQFDSQI